MPGDEPTGYRVLERTVEVHAPLGEAQLATISSLLGRELGGRVGAPGYVIDLTDSCEPGGVLAYLREQRLAHTVAEESRWEPLR